MIGRIKSMSSVLKELILGILLCGLIFQISLVWLADSKLLYTTGLWIGVGISAFMAIHMNHSIENALDMPEEDAAGYSRKMYALRTAVVLVLFGAACYFRLGNVVAIFLGLFTLKFGAYLQPILHKMMQKVKEKGR